MSSLMMLLSYMLLMQTAPATEGFRGHLWGTTDTVVFTDDTEIVCGEPSDRGDTVIYECDKGRTRIFFNFDKTDKGNVLASGQMQVPFEESEAVGMGMFNKYGSGTRVRKGYYRWETQDSAIHMEMRESGLWLIYLDLAGIKAKAEKQKKQDAEKQDKAVEDLKL